MIALLSHRFDAAAQQAVATWPRGEATLLTVTDLSTEGWRVDTERFAEGSFVASGRVYPVQQLSGVINLIPFIHEKELLSVFAEDRSYVASEMTAFLTYWLNRLECPVLNRPAPDLLVRTNWSQATWCRMAAEVGLDVAPEASTQVSQQPVVVLQGRVVNPAGWPVAEAVQTLAEQTGHAYLEAYFTGSAQHPQFVGVSQLPTVQQPAVLRALHEFFNAKSAA